VSAYAGRQLGDGESSPVSVPAQSVAAEVHECTMAPLQVLLQPIGK
jgi:hypothetical protein